MATPNTVESRTTLRDGALTFPSILMQAITHIAPAVGLILTIQFNTTQAGVVAPLTYAIAFGIVLLQGVSLNQLARRLPSAGGYYTYISRAIHPRVGFLTAWLYFLYDPASTALNLAFMGFLFQGMLQSEAGLAVPWWLIFIPVALIVSFLAYRGIEVSVSTMVWLALAEVAIIVALVISALMHPGPGGMNLDSFVISHAPNRSGVYLAVVFSIFAFTGFESVAPLAEESRDPRRNLPRSITLSILLMGIFFVFCSWGLLIGWGTHNTVAFAQSAENPALILAKRYWGRWWVLAAVAVLNSIIGVSIAGTNASSRVFYAMGRSGVLPRMLSAVHPVYKTPVNAIWLQTVLTLGIGLGLGFALGPENEYLFLGVVMTLALILVYSMGNLGVGFFYRREHRSEFNVLLHVALPLTSTIALLWVGYNSIVPLPAPPMRYGGPVVVVWTAAGIVISCFVRPRG